MMRLLLLTSVAISGFVWAPVIPAVFAMVDPPAASKDDARIRTVVYNPNNPVQLYAVPGASLRIQFGADESISKVVTSDQGIMFPDPDEPEPQPKTAGTVLTNGPESNIPPSCDVNLCRSVVGNFVYIKPVRVLDPQPLFIQTKRTNAFGQPEALGYTFELFTRVEVPVPVQVAANPGANITVKPPEPKATIWGVRFVYPDREKAAQVAAWLKAKREREAAGSDLVGRAPAGPVVAGSDSNVRYAYRGSAAVQPDSVWDDGRTTFLRYNGNRRVPNIYNRLPDGGKSIPSYAPEPDATGTTLRISHTDAKWYIWHGDEAGCLFNLGPDPEGRTSATIAPRTATR